MRKCVVMRHILSLTTLVALGCTLFAGVAESDPQWAEFARRAHEKYVAARNRYLAESTNPVATWEFGRVSFDRGEFSTNDTERAAIAEQGIVACRQLIARDINSAEGHYYLGMNLGQLARTKSLGALRIVDEMEREFKLSRALNEKFDCAGSDRNLGLLYLEAPTIASIGSRTKAKQHLLRAAVLFPMYPDNRLNLLEAYMKWGEHAAAGRELDALKKNLPRSRTDFAGEQWAAGWAEWDMRLKKAEARLEGTSKALVSPRHGSS